MNSNLTVYDKMASLGEVIYEDYLYKLNERNRSIFWGKSHPWRQKYIILKRLGNKPLLEFFNKKPKFKQAAPKGKVELWPSYRVEKIANMKNRAYVFQITTPDDTICLSADEQRTMDVFVFFLQIQSRLKDQIRDGLFSVTPENSEAQRRIGAKGTSCLLHVSLYGVTLLLQSNRAILAQWPLKSIRCYESSETGQLSIEAGRIAPMGDGLYIFQTVDRGDNQIYDLLDNYVLDTLDRSQPDRRGNMEEIEDYVLEAESLLGLTVVSACNGDSQDIRNILQNNWNTDVPTKVASRARHIVHTRLTGAGSIASIDSQNSSASNPQTSSLMAGGSVPRNSPHVPRSLPIASQDSGNPRSPASLPDAMASRPPIPPPSSSIPMKQGTARGYARDQYLHMNAFSRSDSSPSPFSPTSADWHSPPSFRDVVKEAELEGSQGSYIHPYPGTVTSTPNHPSATLTRDQYLTPLTVVEDEHEILAGNIVSKSGPTSPIKGRMHRLRSASCEDLSDYLRSVVHDPVSKSMSNLLDDRNASEDEENLEPFPRLQTFSGSIEYDGDHSRENYYNIEGLKGKIYDGPGLTVREIRKRFTKKSQSQIRRSVSNPNFLSLKRRDNLNSARKNAGVVVNQHHQSRVSTSLKNLLPEALKKHLSKNDHPGSHHELSSGASSAKHSRAGSQASSAQSSPSSTLSKKHRTTQRDDIVAHTTVKGINVTKRSRSFKKQRNHDGDNTNSPTKEGQGADQGSELRGQNGDYIDLTNRANGRGTSNVYDALVETNGARSKTSQNTLGVELGSNMAASGTSVQSGASLSKAEAADSIQTSAGKKFKPPLVAPKPKSARPKAEEAVSTV